MPVIKQKTVKDRQGNKIQKIGLKRTKPEEGSICAQRGAQFSYKVVDLDTGSKLGQSFCRKDRAMDEFEASIDQIKRGHRAQQRDKGLGLSGGGGGGGLPTLDDLM